MARNIAYRHEITLGHWAFSAKRPALWRKKRGAAAKKGGSRSAKAGLIFPVGRVGSLLRRGQYARRVGASSAVYLAAVLEYLTAELLELTVKAASQQKNKSKRLNPRTKREVD